MSIASIAKTFGICIDKSLNTHFQRVRCLRYAAFLTFRHYLKYNVTFDAPCSAHRPSYAFQLRIPTLEIFLVGRGSLLPQNQFARELHGRETKDGCRPTPYKTPPQPHALVGFGREYRTPHMHAWGAGQKQHKKQRINLGKTHTHTHTRRQGMSSTIPFEQRSKQHNSV